MKRKILKVLLCLFLIAAVFVSAVAVSIISYGNKDEAQPSDAVIVLGAGAFDDYISPVFRERIDHGIRLYESGFADYIIFTGGYPEGSTKSEAAAAKEYALERGIPDEAIFTEEISRTTDDNLRYAKEIMDENGFETAIIVSDPLHMKRAMFLAKDHGISAVSSPTPTTMYQSFKTQLPFLIRETAFYMGYRLVCLLR